MKFSSKPMYHWTSGNLANKKRYLENYARRRGMDPLAPSTWYSISKSSFSEDKVKKEDKSGLTSVLI